MRIPVVVAVISLCAAVAAAAPAKPPAEALNRLKSLPDATVLQDSQTGEVRFVTGRLAEGVAAGQEVQATLGFLKQNREAYGLADPDSEVKARRLDVEPNGQRHLRLQQEFQGVPVYGTSLIAHFTADGTLKGVNGNLAKSLKVDTNPQMNAAGAVDAAQVDLDAFFGAAEVKGDPQLVVLPWEDKQYLAWRMELFSATPMGRWEYFVDARTGEVIFKANRIQDVDAVGTGTSVMGDARNHIDVDYYGGIYRMIDQTRQANNNPHGHDGQMADGEYIVTYVAGSSLPGSIATDADNVWDASSQAPSVDGQVMTALVYDWMLDQFGRNSYDDAGSTMITSVEYSAEGDNNAYWNGVQIVVWTASSGWRSLAGCPDVIAHEWGHAITDYGSNLVYQKESGALNESFSDMVGAAFEFAHDTIDTPDWLMGENGQLSGNAFRSMESPTLYGDPDTYEGSYWVDVDNCTPSDPNDYCGVHTNSGVGNKWFYLLSDGGTHNGVTVTGIGVENAINIAYRANLYYWSEFTTYSEAAYGTITAADDLDGTGVWAEQVRNAWDAVQVPLPAPQLAFSYPSGLPSLLVPGEETTFDVTVEATYDGTVVSNSGNLYYRIDGGTIQSTLMTELSPGQYEATLPAVNCGQTIEYVVEAYETTSGQFLSPGGGQWYFAAPGTDQITLFEDDFESDLGWTAQPDWARGTPTGGGGEYGGPDPSFAVSGTNIYGYNLYGDYPNNLGERYLTSPAIDCSAVSNVRVNFQRWLGVEQSVYDHASIAVSTNGSSWTTVWESTDEVADVFWTPMEVDISSVAAGEPTVYVRFVMGTTDGGWRFCGWNIDDFVVSGFLCNQTGTDGDSDGVIDILDNCPSTSNPLQEDADNDGVGDACDICNGYDDALDADADGVPDGCDLCAGFDDAVDGDSDGVPDGCDNCPYTPNPGQEDINNDQVGDLCCCEGKVGDANGDGNPQPTIGDISAIIDLLFVTENPLNCYQEADINQSGGLNATKDDITVGDISYLIDYLFIAGPENMTLFDCPQ